MSCCSCYKQRLIAGVENNALNAQLWVITQRVVAADLKPAPALTTVAAIASNNAYDAIIMAQPL